MVIRVSSLKSYLYSTLPFMVIMVLAYVWGLRPADFGADTANYIRIFNSTNQWAGGAIEFGFTAYINFVKIFTQNSQIFLIITSMITASLIYISGYILLGGRNVFHFVVFLTLSPFFLALLTNVIRQGLTIAIVIFTYALSVRLKSGRIIILLGIIVGSSIHLPTAVILLPLLYKRSIKYPMILWTLSVVVSFFSSYYSQYVSSFISGKYDIYLQNSYNYETGVRWQFIVFSLFPFVSMLFIRFKHVPAKYKQLFNQYLMINAVSLLFNFLPYYDRFLLSSWALMPFLFTFVADAIWTRGTLRVRVLKLLGLYITIITGFWVVYILTN